MQTHNKTKQNIKNKNTIKSLIIKMVKINSFSELSSYDKLNIAGDSNSSIRIYG